MNSEPHLKAMLSSNAKRAGLGIVVEEREDIRELGAL